MGDLEILGCKLIMTCYVCPEQYDVFLGDRQIGYLRLRWGHFTADYPDVGGELVYEAGLGDGFAGSFETIEERQTHLTAAVKALLARDNKEKEELS